MAVKKRVMRVVSVLFVALATGHAAESLRAPVEGKLVLSLADTVVQPVSPPSSGLPKSASLSSGLAGTAPQLSAITSVSAGSERPASDCASQLALGTASSAMIQMSLDAPCNRSQRVVIRHAGLSFAARTDTSGHLTLQFPAMSAEALVAVYLPGAEVVLAEVAVPEIKAMTRFALQWETVGQFSLRVVDGDVVYVGDGNGDIVSLGSSSVQDPLYAEVYTLPAKGATDVNLTAELHITPETCGRTLPVQTIISRNGLVEIRDIPVAVPLCGTAGDILVLKNLAPDPTLSIPR